jgi:DNA polymerase-3 subunit epsilon
MIKVISRFGVIAVNSASNDNTLSSDETKRLQERIVVLDFETTGLSALGGDRAIEVGAVVLENGKITDQYQSLIQTDFRVDSFIENYTGITNHMLAQAPHPDQVFPELFRFIDDSIMVAHNAGFDRKFLDMELAQLGYARQQPFLCSMRIARRLYQDAPNHKLGTLINHAKVPVTGTFHRALADAEMTALLWLEMMGLLRHRYKISEISLHLLLQLEKKTIKQTDRWLRETQGH